MADLSEDQIELLRKKISGWVRQSRFRANKNGCAVDIELEDIIKLYIKTDYKCAYCGSLAGSPDHPFPVKDHSPCVMANTVPCCDKCRSKKKNHDIIWFYKNGFITKEQLISLINDMKTRSGSELLKEHIKSLVPPNGD